MANNTTVSDSPDIFTNIVVTGIPVITIIANIPAVILVFWITIKKNNVKNLHLLSIGITDEFVGLFALLMAETFTHTTKKFSFYDCVFRYYMFSVTFVASLLHVLGICIQRLYIFLSDIKIQQNHKIQELTVIVVSWVLSVIINTIGFGVWIDEREAPICSLDELVMGHEHTVFTFFGGVYASLILLVMMAMVVLIRVIYVKTKTLLRQSRRPKDLKVCATIGIIALLFLVTTTPLTYTLLMNENLGESKRQIRCICSVISLMNSSINPFVYLFRIKEFRDAFKELVRCNNNNSVRPSNVINVIPLNQAAYPGPSNSISIYNMTTTQQNIRINQRTCILTPRANHKQQTTQHKERILRGKQRSMKFLSVTNHK